MEGTRSQRNEWAKPVEGEAIDETELLEETEGISNKKIITALNDIQL